MESRPKRKLLLCEDTELLNRTIREFFEKKGFEVFCAFDGQEAWEMIPVVQPDVIITDYETPRMTGLDLLALVSASGIRTPVVFMTSAGTEKVAAEALNLGAAGYVIKGRREEMLLTLHRAMGRVLYQVDLELENKALVQELREQRDHLERTVAERTKDLSDAVAKLESLDKMKSDFMTLVSHEMRTPLSSIIGFSEILTQELASSDEEVREIHHHLLEAGTRLSEFINDAIELFQWLSGNVPIDVASVCVTDMIDLSILASQSAAHDRSVTIEFDETTSGEVEGDIAVLQDALTRVLDNAIKYSEPGGRVECVADTLPDGGIAIRVIDHGVGIAPERAESLFRPLEICGDLNHHQEGQGLGLAIVREEVHSHGGTIEVFSAGVGEGTTVTITLAAEIPAESRARIVRRSRHPLLQQVLGDKATTL